jgi:hypothetical protein
VLQIFIGTQVAFEKDVLAILDLAYPYLEMRTRVALSGFEHELRQLPQEELGT